MVEISRRSLTFQQGTKVVSSDGILRWQNPAEVASAWKVWDGAIFHCFFIVFYWFSIALFC